MEIKPPEYANSVLKTLENAGFEACFVGGCVRDMLLCRRPQDWDVCTSALPEDTERLFRRTIPTGKKHGTITVRRGGHSVEVTTYRAESAYVGHRRPEQVRFVPELREDLRRRDFTINAMALRLSGERIDPFDGQGDLRSGLIRCVGDPRERFEEDALRMFRAIRFAAKLGFSVEKQTLAAICENAPLAASLAPERVHTELEGILLSARPELLRELISVGLLERFLRRGEALPDLARLRRLPKRRGPRWAGFCAALLKAERIDDTARFLRALRLDGETIRACTLGVEAARGRPPADAVDWKRLLSEIGEEAALCAASAVETTNGGAAVRRLRAVLRGGEPYSLRQLAVGGDDLKRLGFQGKTVGAVLCRLLEEVISDPRKNEKETLLSIANTLSEAVRYEQN